MESEKEMKYEYTNKEVGESLRWHKFPVLSDGYICLVDWMGDDNAITESARVCYGRDRRPAQSEESLISYLLGHQHYSPFEMCELKFLVRVPMDCWRQWVRHRTASINETSTRYTECPCAFDIVDVGEWRLQSDNNRQGSDGIVDISTSAELTETEMKFLDLAKKVYNERLMSGVAREQARKDLPLSTYTEAYWKIDLRNLLHFLSLRMDRHAQFEIRQYANIIGNEIVAKLFPMTWKAFKNYELDAIRLSGDEVRVFKSLLSCEGNGTLEDTLKKCLESPESWKQDKCRARSEFIEKLNQLGIK